MVKWVILLVFLGISCVPVSSLRQPPQEEVPIPPLSRKSATLDIPSSIGFSKCLGSGCRTTETLDLESSDRGRPVFLRGQEIDAKLRKNDQWGCLSVHFGDKTLVLSLATREHLYQETSEIAFFFVIDQTKVHEDTCQSLSLGAVFYDAQDACPSGSCQSTGMTLHPLNKNLSSLTLGLRPSPPPPPISTPNPRREEDPDICSETTPQVKQREDLADCTLPPEQEEGIPSLSSRFNGLGAEVSLCTRVFEKVLCSEKDESWVTVRTHADDRNFISIYSGPQGGRFPEGNENPNVITSRSITEVRYGGVVLYKDGEYLRGEEKDFLFGGSNDRLSGSSFIKVKRQLLEGIDSLGDLKIKYKVDGTCKAQNEKGSVIKCSKFYIHGQVAGRVDDHVGPPRFKVPDYASPEGMFIEINGQVLYPSSSGWNIVNGAIILDPQEVQIHGGDVLRIDYFSQNVGGGDSFQSRKEAFIDIEPLCGCNKKDLFCGIKKIGKNYVCYNANSLPSFLSLSLKTKAIPLRYFNENGIEVSRIPLSSRTQTSSVMEGANERFREVYGVIDESSVLPPLEVIVEESQVYDITVGTLEDSFLKFCSGCGTDYDGTLFNRIPLFPQFILGGGGVVPDEMTTKREPTKNTQSPADYFLFGRACWLPMTMIPQTHTANTDEVGSYQQKSQNQRLGRLKTQNFLFSNGYSRDWFGFDYGSVIGSFDGVHWFSVGDSRTVTAKSDRLYLAFNAYTADYTPVREVPITIQVSTPTSPRGAEDDYQSTGAQCRKFHSCKEDRDCHSRLGWDYACENVDELGQTKWPIFNRSGHERLGEEEVLLRDLFWPLEITRVEEKEDDEEEDDDDGFRRRCVYRGRGALCESNNSSCSPNNVCQNLDSSSFNLNISRLSYEQIRARGLDTFGLGAPFVGRPLFFNGKKQPPQDIIEKLPDSVGVCIPGDGSGREEFLGDRVLNIGMSTASGSVASCPGTNIVQENLSTNLLSLFDNQNRSLGLLQENSNPLTELRLEKNRCFRAPGASCFTDLDCATGSFVSKFLARAFPRSNYDTFINENELSFWKEEMICSKGEEEKEKNRCCRDIKKTLTIPTAVDHSLNTSSVVGLHENNISPSDPERFSGNAIVYGEGPSLSAHFNQVTPPVDYQWVTLDTYGKRACCSGSWIRQFSDGSHNWKNVKRRFPEA